MYMRKYRELMQTNNLHPNRLNQAFRHGNHVHLKPDTM